MIIQAYFARLKTCPLMLTAPEPKQCIRSTCMAWRWDKSVSKTTKFTTDNKDDFKGFCGLAGEPVSEAVITDV